MKTWENISGYTNFLQFYAGMVKAAPEDAHFVEIGSWVGRSSAFMVHCIKESGKNIKFDCIDLWELGNWSDEDHFKQLKDYLKEGETDFYSVFINNMKATDSLDYLTPIKEDSLKASFKYTNESIDLVFIDAGHSYKSVMRDIAFWWKKVKPGGILAGDDYNWKDVQDAVNDFAKIIGKDFIPRNRNTWIVGKE